MVDRKTRNSIIEAADRLFYQQGYEHTSFTSISDSVGISRGNFYYHFKSKDEILDAVIDLRVEKTQQMLLKWEVDFSDPIKRIECFIDMLIANQTLIIKYGCPVGTLCVELAKLGHASQDRANELFMLFRNWLAQQFTALGLTSMPDTLAMHLLARSQGIATLANAFRDDTFIEQEVIFLKAWLKMQIESTEFAGN